VAWAVAWAAAMAQATKATAAAWVAGGGLDGGGGETLAACAAAACRSGGPRPVASILCERMRSGRCQHVCMRCDPPSEFEPSRAP